VEDQLRRAERAAALAELALAAKGSDADQKRKSALAAIEAEAGAAGDDRLLHDDLLMQTIGLVRSVRGDKAAAAVFRDAERARVAVRARSNIDAALAFEALGDLPSAVRAYAVLADPALVRRAGIERVIAAIRLHKIGPAAGEALSPTTALYEKLEKGADVGLIDTIEKLK